MILRKIVSTVWQCFILYSNSHETKNGWWDGDAFTWNSMVWQTSLRCDVMACAFKFIFSVCILIIIFIAKFFTLTFRIRMASIIYARISYNSHWRSRGSSITVYNRIIIVKINNHCKLSRIFKLQAWDTHRRNWLNASANDGTLPHNLLRKNGEICLIFQVYR